ncbi:hypothetical protein [Erwinia tracheiphila]|uniref:Uncharacterized protein n=1 Tax=Erwinia tracheiphila TaxID=65700 RepID=A0A0M2K532_9GAMM|nr:hypothetical protein [Erwinia tracheiphila]KKF34054.1 hypothetical protein SY86_25840 [Erwinia tracheiphila]
MDLKHQKLYCNIKDATRGYGWRYCAESLEGARRYQTINKNSHIYRIDGKNVEGVSLRDNLYTNEKGLNDFLGEPLAKNTPP